MDEARSRRRLKLREAGVRAVVARATKCRRLGVPSIRRLRRALKTARRWEAHCSLYDSSSSSRRARALVEVAAKDLGLALLQKGIDASDEVLRRHFPRARYRLSDAALRFQGLSSPALSSSSSLEEDPWRVVDDGLDGRTLGLLKRAFSRDFWRAHAYVASKPRSDGGYFSYVHDLEEDSSSSPITATYARALVRFLRKKNHFPALRAARYVEWWCHRRPPGGAHQLHFDSDDEGRGVRLRHPLVSTVLYLDDVGGPTLLTRQAAADTKVLKQEGGHLVFPKKGRVLAFRGDLLHAVLPALPAPRDARKRRTTLMMAFWTDLNTLRPFRRDTLGASAVTFPNKHEATRTDWLRPFFPANTTTTTVVLAPTNDDDDDDGGVGKRQQRTDRVATCPALWAPLPCWETKKKNKKNNNDDLNDDDLNDDDDQSDDDQNDDDQNASGKRRAEDISPLPPYDAIFQGF